MKNLIERLSSIENCDELNEAITARGIRATMDRVVEKINTFIPRVAGTSYASAFKADLKRFATKLNGIADSL